MALGSGAREMNGDGRKGRRQEPGLGSSLRRRPEDALQCPGGW